MKDQRIAICKICAQRKIPFQLLVNNGNHSYPGMNVENHGTEDFLVLSKGGVLHSILDIHLLRNILDSLKVEGPSERGSGQISAGYASLNIKLDDEHSVTCPQTLGTTTPKLVEKMVAMTSVVKQLCERRSIPLPYQGNPRRSAEWAQMLCSKFGVEGENIFEQVTFAVYLCIQGR